MSVRKRDFENLAEMRDFQERMKIVKEGTTRIRTSFIFALAVFEEVFADVVEDYPDDWKNFRKKVLDNGNYQIRLWENVFEPRDTVEMRNLGDKNNV